MSGCVDNVLLGSGPAMTIPLGSRATKTLRLGKFGVPYLKAQLDELNVWDRVLTSTERSQLYNTGSAFYGPTSYGNATYNDYDRLNGGEWRHYELAVGSAYTGLVSRLFFMNQGTDANAGFRNMYVHEAL